MLIIVSYCVPSGIKSCNYVCLTSRYKLFLIISFIDEIAESLVVEQIE